METEASETIRGRLVSEGHGGGSMQAGRGRCQKTRNKCYMHCCYCNTSRSHRYRKFLFIFSQCLKYVLRCSLTSTKSLATSSTDTDLSCSIVNGISLPPMHPCITRAREQPPPLSPCCRRLLHGDVIT